MYRDVSLLIDQKGIEQSLVIAKQPYVLCCNYPELLAQNSYQVSDLMTAKAEGADIRIVYTIDDAINLAKLYPAKQIIFIAVGFEGEMLTTAKALCKVKHQCIQNFSVFIQHKTALNAVAECLESMPQKVETATGILLPEAFTKNSAAQLHTLQVRSQQPMVISGYEAVDILQSILYLIRQNNLHGKALINQSHHSIAIVENQQNAEYLTDVFIPQFDSTTAPISVQQAFLPFTVSLGVDSQAVNFLQQPCHYIDPTQVNQHSTVASQLQ